MGGRIDGRNAEITLRNALDALRLGESRTANRYLSGVQAESSEQFRSAPG